VSIAYSHSPLKRFRYAEPERDFPALPAPPVGLETIGSGGMPRGDPLLGRAVLGGADLLAEGRGVATLVTFFAPWLPKLPVLAAV